MLSKYHVKFQAKVQLNWQDLYCHLGLKDISCKIVVDIPLPNVHQVHLKL